MSIEPVTFRLPRNGETDPYFGGSRTFWNLQVNGRKARKGKPAMKPTVASVVRKEPGTKRGIRFILYSSAKSFFEKLAKEQGQSEKAA